MHAPSGAAGVGGGVEEPRGFGFADEEWGDGEVEFVGEALGEEGCVDLAASFDHEAVDAALAEVVEEGAEVDFGAGGDDVGEAGQGGAQLLLCGVRRVGDFLTAVVPELQVGVEGRRSR